VGSEVGGVVGRVEDGQCEIEPYFTDRDQAGDVLFHEFKDAL
jgi:hypothetical protein